MSLIAEDKQEPGTAMADNRMESPNTGSGLHNEFLDCDDQHSPMEIQHPRRRTLSAGARDKFTDYGAMLAGSTTNYGPIAGKSRGTSGSVESPRGGQSRPVTPVRRSRDEMEKVPPEAMADGDEDLGTTAFENESEEPEGGRGSGARCSARLGGRPWQ